MNQSPKPLDKVYLEIEQKIINLMLRHSDTIAEMLDSGIRPDFFDQRHRPLVQAIYYVHGISDGKRLLTDDHYRSLLIEQGGKGDITIAMQVHHDCMFGVHFSNSKDNCDLLKRQLIDSFVHREGLKALKRFNKDVPTMGYLKATRRFGEQLQGAVGAAAGSSAGALRMRTFTASGLARSLFVIFAVLAASGCRSVSSGSGDGDDRSDGGRIPRCLAEDGIDLFAAEADEVLGITWNNLGESDAEGGYRVRFGTSAEDLSDEVLSDCTDLECEHNLAPLQNGVVYFLAVESLNADGVVTQTSCTISATPHPLAFLTDVRVHDATEGTQDFPDIIAGEEGSPLFLAWEDGGAIRLSRSDNLGDSWSEPITVGSGANQSGVALAFRDLVEQTIEHDDGTETAQVVEEPFLLLAYTEGSQVMLTRAGFPDGLDGGASFDTPLSLGSGTDPGIALGPSSIHVTFEDGDQIFVVSLDPDVLSVETPVRVDTGSGDAHAPSITAHSETGDVYVAYHARRGAGDFNVYANVSTDGGATFDDEEARVDDDASGQNQLNISITVDERTNQLLATWEDRRGGANIFFASSEDNGLTWGTNIETGAGLAGDQFTPKAVADPGRNSYVVFIDTSDGHRPMFSRFNPDRTFDPPLPVSTAAGKAGATAQNPAVAIDKFGSIFVTWSENRGSPNVDVYFARAE